MKLNEHNIALLYQYLRENSKNHALPACQRLREVYTDESYIHHHYSRDNDSIWDPFDTRYELPRAKHKGRRFCICAAMQGPGRASSSGIVPGAVWIFCPQRKDASTGDYHKNFNAQNYMSWFKNKLLANLKEPSIIIHDNASYHKALSENTPRPRKRKKAELLEMLRAKKFDMTQM